MAPYEALYGRKFTSPIGWVDVRESRLHRPDLVQQAIEKVKLIQELLLKTQSRQKSYSDMRRQDLEFGVDDWVFLKVSPMKGVMRFGKKGKLSPLYIGPYRFILRVDRVAFELDFPSESKSVHSSFYVYMLRKCIGDPTPVVHTDDVQITKDLSYEKVPVAILDRQICKLQNKEVASVKVLWRSKNVEEMIWEAEGKMRSKYPHIFQTEDMARDGIHQHCSIQASRCSGKDNVVVDALSRRSMGSLAHVEAKKREQAREIHQLGCLGVQLVGFGNGGVVLQNTTKSSLIAEVKERQYEDKELFELRERVS
ncbi:uncharacterized protein [Nicotiana tomentosiformis]|uniref:uncharacterized protein n=1 Tax=Nicotiana tomentosiformis TaxID=4098 RepID=UPI00388C638F